MTIGYIVPRPVGVHQKIDFHRLTGIKRHGPTLAEADRHNRELL